MRAYAANDESPEPLSLPSYCTRTPRLLITPTRLVVNGISVEMSNRVVRHFISNEGFEPESFLRVYIGDENGSQLFSDELSNKVCLRIEYLLLHGLTLNGRKYRFLAYSSSQLKECALWMVNPPVGWSVDAIRTWMGDFSGCKGASKVAARMGQCFSTTVVAQETNSFDSLLKPRDDFPDIVSVHNGREMCHSDGTGIIDRSVMENLVAQLPILRCDPAEISIIQIRYGGAKGTLTGWDLGELQAQESIPSYPVESNVLLRPSMVKFNAAYRELEVVSVGKQTAYYLNRNVILLLGVHSVRDEVFTGLQEQMLNDLDTMLFDRKKAIHMIPRLSGAESTLSATLVHMLSSGLSPGDEPFLFSCIQVIMGHHRTALRKRSRVFVEKGAVLLGGIDETGLLPEGCVYLQIRPSGLRPDRSGGNVDDSEYRVIEGPVMVTKHPTMHPGDVRMLLAVDIPELRQHKNCILFSQQGTRPEADKMSGSDLDGDQFAVTWDERLFLGEWNCCVRQQSGEWWSSHGTRILMQPSTMSLDAHALQKANCEPMDFDQGAENESTTLSTTDEELISHLLKHAKNDCLGQVSSLWLDYAAKEGADCGPCLRLAELHSVAVDFPKSGKPAMVPKNLIIPRSVPRAHWREKKDSPSYHCAGPIGRMYDDVINRMGDKGASGRYALPLAGRRFDRNGQVIRFGKVDRALTCLKTLYKQNFAIRLGLDLEVAAVDPDSLSFKMIEEALDHRDDYEKGLVQIMSKYGVQCEGELLTGCIRKYHKLDKKRQHALSEIVRAQVRELRSHHRRMFFSFVLHTVLGTKLNETISDKDVENEVWIDCVESAALGRKEFPEGHSFSAEEIKAFVVASRQLAAAYYVATYNPDIRWEGDLSSESSSLLFSFPWLVADIIAAGLL